MHPPPLMLPPGLAEDQGPYHAHRQTTVSPTVSDFQPMGRQCQRSVHVLGVQPRRTDLSASRGSRDVGGLQCEYSPALRRCEAGFLLPSTTVVGLTVTDSQSRSTPLGPWLAWQLGAPTRQQREQPEVLAGSVHHCSNWLFRGSLLTHSSL